MISPDQLHALFASYGVWTVAFIVGLESLGVPLPGETVLILASLYAATHNVPIALVIGAATLGRHCRRQHRLRSRTRNWLSATSEVRSLSWINGGAHQTRPVPVYEAWRKGRVLWRFLAVLRVLAAFLAGVNRLAWPRFLVANALGGEPIGMPGTARPIALGLPASNAGWHVSAHDLQRHSRRSRRYDRRKVLSEHRRVLSLLVCLRYPRRSP